MFYLSIPNTLTFKECNNVKISEIATGINNVNDNNHKNRIYLNIYMH